MNEATSKWVKIAWFDRKLANKEKEGRASMWGRKTNTTGGYNILLHRLNFSYGTFI